MRIPMTQDPEQRKANIANARAKHHSEQLKTKKRVDAYISQEAKQGLQTLKKAHGLKNEGSAIEKAVEIALANS